MVAVNTATGHQMSGNCGKARNYHALRWLVDPLKAYNGQNVQILSFYPKSPRRDGECHLAAYSAKQDAVALLSHWCSISTWQDETD